MEKQVKSKKRVKEHAEVFTAEREVKAMCDLVKEETERIDSTFLEPSCGEGNFLIEILTRKLNTVKQNCSNNKHDYELCSIIAISSIYGIELLTDNVKACKKRLYNYWEQQYTSLFKDNVDEEVKKSIKTIFDKNIIQGNALSTKCVDDTGKDTDKPITFCEWNFIGNDLFTMRECTLESMLNPTNTLFNNSSKQYLLNYNKIYCEF